ncbi:MAG: hypothetical protein E7493_13845 [Ruminococcus albus]|nr:hypothetical protein [Ruminococcus albus]
MEITKLLSLAADEEKNAFDGLFSGAGGIVGIVLIVTGVLIIYIGIKVMKGYSFMPTLGVETVIEEDTYVEGTATLVSQQKTILPDFNGTGEREFTEWTISYTVGGEEYTQTIPDDGYSKGDTIKIKYDPQKPDEYYLAEEAEEEAAEEADNTDERKSRNSGAILIVLGVIVIVGGAALVTM